MAELRIAITTTPRANTTRKVGEWIAWAQAHFAGIPGCSAKLLAAMPTRPSAAVATELDLLLPDARGGDRYWAAMEPGFIGAGDTFRGACFFAFADDPGVEYALHVPIDVDFLNPHADDVQDNVKRLVKDILEAGGANRPDLVIGDYVPMIWDESTRTGKDSPFKALLEDHVKQQLLHYFPDNNIVARLGIARPRSEFFAISRRLFEDLNTQRRFSPWDPLPQILIYADRMKLAVHRKPLGKFYELDPKFRSASIRDQVWRTACQISSEWLRWEHERTPKLDDVRRLEVEWEETILQGTILAFKALRRMLDDPRVL